MPTEFRWSGFIESIWGVETGFMSMEGVIFLDGGAIFV